MNYSLSQNAPHSNTLTNQAAPVLLGVNQLHYFVMSTGQVLAHTSPLSIYYVGSGSVSCNLDGRRYLLRKGQFIITKPGSSLLISLHGEENSEIVAVTLNYESYFILAKKMGATQEILDAAYQGENSLIGRLLEELISWCQSDETFENSTYHKQVAETLADHQSEIWRKINLIDSIKMSTKEEIYRRILKVELYIEQELPKKINLSELCEVAGLSRFHFLRKFHEANGLSPHQYILRRKIQKSCGMIKQKNLTLSEIADQIGFSDIHSFSKVFRRIMGFPPSQLRKKA